MTYSARVRGYASRCKQDALYRAKRFFPQIIGRAKGNAVPAFWFSRQANFGDLITPLLLRHYGYTPILTRPGDASLCATGSILEAFSQNYRGIILGSGFIERGEPVHFPAAKVLAVRGHLTRMRLGINIGLPLGDPGLLASEVVAARQTKRYPLGIVPHYVEKHAAPYRKLKERLGNRLLFIDPQDHPLQVFEAIAQCESILSSSLHGLIVADSFAIPNAWLSSKKLVGGDFKFLDYYSAIGVDPSAVVLTGEEVLDDLISMTHPKPAFRIESCKQALIPLWKSLRDCL